MKWFHWAGSLPRHAECRGTRRTGRRGRRRLEWHRSGDGSGPIESLAIAAIVSSGRSLTSTGQIVGTIDYIAPEQIQDKTVDGRADLYALGCVLYQCLTGVVPFPRDEAAALMWAHVNEEAEPVTARRPDLPPQIDSIVARRWLPNAAEQALLDQVPLALTMKNSCTRNDEAEQDTVNVEASVICKPDGDSANKVVFTKFTSPKALDTRYRTVVATTGIGPSTGDCLNTERAETTYTSVSSRTSGRTVCYQQRGSSFVTWTDDQAQVLGLATRVDPNYLKLRDWWAGVVGMPTTVEREADAQARKQVEDAQKEADAAKKQLEDAQKQAEETKRQQAEEDRKRQEEDARKQEENGSRTPRSRLMTRSGRRKNLKES